MRRIACLAAMLATVSLATAARASWPCGIYARIDKVEFEPNADKPERIKVWGDFLMVKTSNRLVGPERGYMYFSLVEKKVEQCRIEWKDLQKIAGTKNNSRVGKTALSWSRFARLFAKNCGVNAKYDSSATNATMNKYPITPEK